MMAVSEAPYLTQPQGMLRGEGFKGKPAVTPDPPRCTDVSTDISVDSVLVKHDPSDTL